MWIVCRLHRVRRTPAHMLRRGLRGQGSVGLQSMKSCIPSTTWKEGWKGSILSFPKKWLSTVDQQPGNDSEEYNNADNVELPKLPLPPLEQTLARYLEMLEPVVSAGQLASTKSIVRSFGAPNGPGPKLQTLLEKRRENCDNWVYEYWLNDMYLNVRNSLPIHCNPGMVFPLRHFLTSHDVAKFAAKMVDGIVEHKEMLDRGELPIERATSREKGQPMCMAQFYRLLTSCREPGIDRDRLHTLPQPSPDNLEGRDEHVIVACRNQFYCVAVKAADRGRLTEQELTEQMLAVLSEAPGLRAPPAIGVLTGARRDTWARARDIICQDEANRRNLELIAGALCIVCLDEPLPSGWTRNAGGPSALMDDTSRLHHALHGGGSAYNSPNRWFDKTVQLIISNDGMCGLCYEHSPAEGVAVVRLVEDLLKKAEQPPPSPRATPAHLPPPERLQWNITPSVQSTIKEVSHDLDKLIEDLDLFVYRYKGYGKDFIKSCRVSPDVYIQLALQLAYYSHYGNLVPTYESASVRRFLQGRVDNIRSASMEAQRWAEAMCADRDPLPARKVSFSIYSEQKKMELFELAVRKQTDIMVQNILGQGIDNHMLGLREIAREANNGKVPEIFRDESFKFSFAFKLSTSQVACSTDSYMGYGPVVPNGYGASYNPHPKQIIFCLSSFFSSSETDSKEFGKTLGEALDSIRSLFESTKKE